MTTTSPTPGMKTILAIAGSDSGAGAGIQQDIKAAAAMGCYATTALTAVTAQNTAGVTHVMPLPPHVVRKQIEAVFEDFDVAAIKVGMLPDAGVLQAVVSAITQCCQDRGIPPVIYDPVMVSTSGTPLMQADCMEAAERLLFPVCTLVTPNIPEAERLSHLPVTSPAQLEAAGRHLVHTRHTAFLLKGGHAAGDTMTDTLFLEDSTVHTYTLPKLHTRNLHGTGCATSTAIAAALAMGHSLPDAVRLAKQLVFRAIQRAQHTDIGHGNGPILFF